MNNIKATIHVDIVLCSFINAWYVNVEFLRNHGDAMLLCA